MNLLLGSHCHKHKSTIEEEPKNPIGFGQNFEQNQLVFDDFKRQHLHHQDSQDSLLDALLPSQKQVDLTPPEDKLQFEYSEEEEELNCDRQVTVDEANNDLQIRFQNKDSNTLTRSVYMQYLDFIKTHKIVQVKKQQQVSGGDSASKCTTTGSKTTPQSD